MRFLCGGKSRGALPQGVTFQIGIASHTKPIEDIPVCSSVL
ncbi:hypothetical protein [Escherichia phage Ecp_YSF]|nr:hypothetical protein [Escherichia phage Ecp_YSF]